MKIAVAGSRTVFKIDLDPYVSAGDEIISGGAKGVDSLAAAYAKSHGLKLVEILPDYARYGRGAPIKRNDEIVDCADRVVVFWDGKSKGTLSVIKYAEKTGKPCEIVLCEGN